MQINKEKLNKLVKEICVVLGLTIPYTIFRIDEKINQLPEEKIEESIKIIKKSINET